MTQIEWSAGAISDLQQISEYVERENSLEIANRVAQTIYDTVQSLRKMPYRGRMGRSVGTRELVVSKLPYLIIYQVREVSVIIVAVVHGAQKWP